ncbi:conserved hypothetical protein [uncultured Defluviicoccus sp.]|uniref:Uncharacterized protein n=1 Tax=metagenome TaxID=256318 RepID=A0A380TJU5_9ZZZZ|nr:conserved hypothetical protein [uncultured Defluviicoccus sp.]
MVEQLQTPSDRGTIRVDAGEANASRPAASDRPAPAALALAGAVEGYIEGVQDRRVFGWAWCRSRPNDPVDVEIQIGDQTLAAVRADRYRGDLAKAGLSEGRHAFEAVLDCTLSAEQKTQVTVHARAQAGEPWVPLVNRTRRAAAKGGDVAEGAAAPSLTRPPSDVEAVLSAIAALEKSVVQGFGRCRADLRDALAAKATAQAAVRDSGTAADSETWREQLSMLVDSIDVLQTRVDTICAALREGGVASDSARRSDRVLMLLVSGLGAVSGAALLLGLFAVFG